MPRPATRRGLANWREGPASEWNAELPAVFPKFVNTEVGIALLGPLAKRHS